MYKKFIVPIIHIIKKFTPLDWIFCITIFLVFIFLLANRLSRQEQWVSVKIKVSNDEWWWQTSYPDSWYGAGLAKGEASYTSFGKKIGEIQSIENYDVGESKRLIFANVKLLTTYNKKTKTYTFAYQTLQIGKPLDLTFDENNVRGLVTYIGDNAIPYGTTEMEVKLLAVYPWEAASYTKGVKMRDFEGNIIGTINEVMVENSTATKIVDIYHKSIILPQPINAYKDVTIRLTARTYSIHDILYYVDGSPIKIGNHIWIEFEHTAIKDGVISNIF